MSQSPQPSQHTSPLPSPPQMILRTASRASTTTRQARRAQILKQSEWGLEDYLSLARERKIMLTNSLGGQNSFSAHQLKILQNSIRLQEEIGLPIHPKYQPPRPTPLLDYQVEILQARERFLWVNKSRKIGITEVMLRRFMWKALTSYAGYQVLFIAQSDDFSARLMRRFQELFHQAPDWIGSLVTKELTDYTALANGCEVFARTSTNASTRGFERVKGLYMTEAAHFLSKDDERIYAAARPNVIATQGDIAVESTPNGQRGMFFRLQNDPAFRKWVLPYTRAPELIDPNEIEKEREALGPVMFSQEFECVTPGTLISCNPDWKNAEEIVVGDKVLTHTCDYQPVEGVLKRPYNGEIVSLRTWFVGDSQPFECTPNHPMLAVKHLNNGGRKARSRSLRLNGADGLWKDADSLQVGDYLIESIPTEVVDKQEIRVLDYFAVPKGFKAKWKVHKLGSVPVDERLMRIITAYICEGNIGANGRGLTLAFGPGDDETVKQIIADLQGLFGVESKIRRVGKCQIIVVNSVVLNHILHSLCGSGSLTKRLPDWAMYLPAGTKQQAIWDMAVECDGFTSKTSSGVIGISRDFILQLRTIALRLGYRPGFYRKLQGTGGGTIRGRPVLSRQPAYEIRIYSHSDSDTWGKKRGMNDGRYFYKRIKSIERLPYNGDVINFQVARSSSFTAGFHTTHNCSFNPNMNAAIPEEYLEDNVLYEEASEML